MEFLLKLDVDGNMRNEEHERVASLLPFKLNQEVFVGDKKGKIIDYVFTIAGMKDEETAVINSVDVEYIIDTGESMISVISSGISLEKKEIEKKYSFDDIKKLIADTKSRDVDHIQSSLKEKIDGLHIDASDISGILDEIYADDISQQFKTLKSKKMDADFSSVSMVSDVSELILKKLSFSAISRNPIGVAIDETDVNENPITFDYNDSVLYHGRKYNLVSKQASVWYIRNSDGFLIPVWEQELIKVG